MVCDDQTEREGLTAAQRRRVAELFSRGKHDVAVAQRSRQCLHAGRCRQPCTAYRKWGECGLWHAGCAEADDGPIGALLKDPDAKCPRGLF